jgi:type I restriction enzyme, S subunit
MTEQNNNIPEGFKMTEIGPLPEEWGVVNVVQCCSFGRGTEPGSDAYNREGIGIPFIRVGNVAAQTQELVYTTSTNVKTCDVNDILMTLDGSPGVVTKGFKGAYSSGIRKVSPNISEIHEDYLFFVLQTEIVRHIIEQYTTGVTIKHASKALPHIIIPLPTLSEQKVIARILSIIQMAIEAQDKIITAAKELKKSLMRHLFTYGPVPVAEAEHVPLKETEIGPVPEQWDLVRLEQVMWLRTENVLPEDVPDIRYVGLEHMDSGEVNLRRWGRTEQVKSAKSRFHPMDILYGKLRPYLDKAALAKWEGVCSTDILVFTASGETALPEYLAALLHTGAFIEHAISTTSGVNHPRTSWSSIKSFAAPRPPVNEQQEIARILSTVDIKIEAEENRKSALQTLFKTMLHQLMTGKVRVKDLEAKAA